LKIALVLGFPNPFPGAGWTRIGFLAENWSKKRNLVEVLGAFTYKSFQQRGVRKCGEVNIFNIIFNMNLACPPVFVLNSFVSFLTSTLFLLARMPDIILVSVPSGDVALGALMACQLLRTERVVDYRDEWEDYRASLTDSKVGKLFYSAVKKLLSIVYQKSQLVTAVTPSFVDSLKGRGVINVKLVPNGADVNVFRPRQKKHQESKDFVMVYVIGPIVYYRLDLVFSAMKLLNKKVRNLKLFLVGKTPSALRDLYSPSEQVVLFGEIADHTKLSEIIAQGDVGLLPLSTSYIQARTALPVKFFEYCACGIPVVASVPDDSILACLIEKHNVGLTVPSMDEKEFSGAVYQLYRNRSLREGAGRRARSLIEREFDRHKIADELLNLVTACLPEKHG
jgi:glycosyltransferase involved in cell wall biosynthesis